jgi:hypothetical protein
MDLREIYCEDGRWIELAKDRVQWPVLVLAYAIRVSTEELHTAAMFLLMMEGNSRVQSWVDLHCHNTHTKYMNLQRLSKINLV